MDIGTIRGFESYVFGNNKYVWIYSPNFMHLGLWGLDQSVCEHQCRMMTNKEPIREVIIYASFGLGCIIRNDYLLFESFQFSFVYPDIPIIGENVFKWNTFESKILIQDFQINKPRPVFTGVIFSVFHEFDASYQSEYLVLFTALFLKIS